MIVVLSEIRCPSCGKRLVKTPECGGDYYKTISGYRLQEYCNGDCEQNGILRPPLEGRDPDFISNRGKTSVAIRIAVANRLGIIESKQIAKSCITNNTSEFISIFSKRIRLPLLEVSRFLG